MILLFLPVKLSYVKRSLLQFLCVKTSRGKVVVTFPYLLVYIWIVGDVPRLPKICTQSDPPVQKTLILTDFV